jgi:hypothetical protein
MIIIIIIIINSGHGHLSPAKMEMSAGGDDPAGWRAALVHPKAEQHRSVDHASTFRVNAGLVKSLDKMTSRSDRRYGVSRVALLFIISCRRLGGNLPAQVGYVQQS